MLYLAALTILTLILSFWVKAKLDKNFSKRQAVFERLRAELKDSKVKNLKLKEDSFKHDRLIEETITLYDITKDICKTLDKEQVFKKFIELMPRYINVDECRFLAPNTDLSGYNLYSVLPLKIHKDIIGYLAAKGLRPEDGEKFHILAGQFLIGIKRALLYKKVQELTITDGLTQVYTRRYFLEKLNEEIQRSKKMNLKLSLLMIDIDRFKSINDNYGHLVGDVVIKETAKTVKDTIRQIDFIGRFGGEELSVVLAETNKEDAFLASERIRVALNSKLIRAYDEELKVTISVGISTFPVDAGQAALLIDRADNALYQAKESGRNRSCFF